jgi:hypothetical protein
MNKPDDRVTAYIHPELDWLYLTTYVGVSRLRSLTLFATVCSVGPVLLGAGIVHRLASRRAKHLIKRSSQPLTGE